MARTLISPTSAIVALCAALLLASAPGPASAKVYFTAFPGEGGTAIERAGFDGGQMEVLQSEPTGFEDGLALDPAAGRMYWTDTNASLIRRANLSGSEAEILIDDLGWEPLGIALDIGGGKVYWDDRQGVKRANLDGSEQELLVKAVTTGEIALDLGARRMYWVAGGAIRSAPMEAGATVSDIVTNQGGTFGLALDERLGRLFWLLLNEKKKLLLVRSANLDGSEANTIVERGGEGLEGGLAIDPAAGQLYWA